MPMKILRDASTVLAAQTGRLEPQAPAKRERTPSGYNCPKANHRVKEQMMSKLSLKMKLAVGFGTLLIILVVIAPWRHRSRQSRRGCQRGRPQSKRKRDAG